MYIYIYIHVYVCVYIYIYMCMYIYIYICRVCYSLVLYVILSEARMYLQWGFQLDAEICFQEGSLSDGFFPDEIPSNSKKHYRRLPSRLPVLRALVSLAPFHSSRLRDFESLAE